MEPRKLNRKIRIADDEDADDFAVEENLDDMEF